MYRVTGIADVFTNGVPVGVGTHASGNDCDWPERAHDHPTWWEIKGRHFCHLSIPANVRQLKQISHTIWSSQIQSKQFGIA